MSFKEDINLHYAGTDLSTRLESVFARAGLTIDTLSRDDIEKFDEFHIRGRDATRELGEMGKFTRGMKLLDIGCGIGGPSRTFAEEFGCFVTGIDITEEYCRMANLFNQQTGLSEKIIVQHADATQMPFTDNSFDAAVTLHVTMNIKDKEQLAKEIYRVLHPRGKYCFYEIFSSDDSEINYPVPWAETPDLSFLSTPDKYFDLFERTGFSLTSLNDQTISGAEAFKSAAQKLKAIIESGELTFSLAILMKDNALEKANTLVRNFEQGKLKVLMGVFSKTGRPRST